MAKHDAYTVDSLRSVIEQLELALDTPMVAGEVADWVDELQKSWDAASEQICLQMKKVHPRQFVAMADEDPELIPKIEKMKLEDREIAAVSDDFHRSMIRFAERVPEFEPDEEKSADAARELIDCGIALVNRIRKQEAVLQTYFIEAFNRDRGIAD